MKDIQKFDVTEHIRNEVRRVFVSSIPDEQMDLMIKKEFETFWDRGKSDYPSRQPGDGVKIVREEIERRTREAVVKWMDANFALRYNEQGVPLLVGELVKELAPIVQAAIVADITQRTIAEIQKKLTMR
jgi:hypothetical protein